MADGKIKHYRDCPSVLPGAQVAGMLKPYAQSLAKWSRRTLPRSAAARRAAAPRGGDRFPGDRGGVRDGQPVAGALGLQLPDPFVRAGERCRLSRPGRRCLTVPVGRGSVAAEPGGAGERPPGLRQAVASFRRRSGPGRRATCRGRRRRGR
ncbi:hypothetical protein Kpho02_51970 [Kitasatospora phosalacinea]|uniref:Uncharacterized protein n=1 Tax=Kitasatospora phosalacinea TaxID=2065 RepID=A0A9W6QDA7_9ACTN|nr:hypothetical protein Kpho02_51970 [Kitasatospora phosalacinea]